MGSCVHFDAIWEERKSQNATGRTVQSLARVVAAARRRPIRVARLPPVSTSWREGTCSSATDADLRFNVGSGALIQRYLPEMLRRRADDGAKRAWRRLLPGAVAIGSLLGCMCRHLASSRPDRVDSLSVILGIAAVGAGVLVAGERGNGWRSPPRSLSATLAAAFLGPASAAVIAVLAELTATLVMRTQWRVVLYTNLPPARACAVAAAVVIRALAPRPEATRRLLPGRATRRSSGPAGQLRDVLCAAPAGVPVSRAVRVANAAGVPPEWRLEHARGARRSRHHASRSATPGSHLRSPESLPSRI